MDWGYSYNGCKWNNDNWEAFMKCQKDGETSVIVDRSEGRISFCIDSKYMMAFQDEEIKSGRLHFSCSSGIEGIEFEIKN